MVGDRWRREDGAAPSLSCCFSGGRSVTTAVTVEDRLGVGLAGRADKQPGRRGEGRGGRKRKAKGVMELEEEEEGGR